MVSFVVNHIWSTLESCADARGIPELIPPIRRRTYIVNIPIIKYNKLHNKKQMEEKRMARHGENIRKRTVGRWEGRYKVFDENRGQYIYRSIYGSDYRETKAKLTMVRLGSVCSSSGKKTATSEDESSSPKSAGGNDGAVLFSQAAEEWLAELSGRRKISTYVKYETAYRTHLDSIIGSCRLSSGMSEI